ncbi:MAG: hypothetical protein ACWA6U_13705 [Breznakibacter sp.]
MARVSNKELNRFLKIKVNDLHWGKTFWIFEQLRKENPDLLALYFKAKRQFALSGKIS